MAPLTSSSGDGPPLPGNQLGGRRQPLRKALRITVITATICSIYLAIVFGGRYLDRAETERKVEKKVSRLPSELEGDELKILHFYASPARVKRGEKGLLCYGVLNAKTVHLNPAVEEIKPALNRCLEIRPVQTTTYGLKADGAGGASVTATFTLPVE